ncbi:MAG: PQQ-binding-like beta-propeller repeat protein [Chloroflexota bacterium]|nr:PQQ-binding-like beta-propeller repeat protein [Chloroflexota bacterium]
MRGFASIRCRIGLLVAALLGCALLPLAVGAYDWPQFNGNGRHGGNNTQETTITAANVHGMQRLFQITLPSNADSAPITLSGVGTMSGTVDLVFVTTRDGRLIALNGHTGATVWSVQHGASACQINDTAPVPNPTNPCHTNASPVIDPNRQFIYAYGLDGSVHKHSVSTGSEVIGGGWPELVTTKPFNEKGSSHLSITTDARANTYLYVASGGYPGDNGDYQGHITTIALATGTQHVFNMLCSTEAVHFVQTPGSPDCAGQTQSAVWARSGVVYDADTDRIYAATGNGTFDAAHHDWGDSVVALNPDGTGNGNGDPLDSYTPTNFQLLQNNDTDLGSTAPAILPTPPGCAVPHLAVQGGKDGKIRLLNLDNLSGMGGPGHIGGEIAGSLVDVPGSGEMLTAPAVWTNPGDSTTWAFTSTTGGIAGLHLTCPNGGIPSLTAIWQHTTSGFGTTSSPLVANGALFAASNSGALSAFDPTNGNALWTTTVGGIHWESPVVANGILYMPDQGNHLTAFSPLAIATVTPPIGRTAGGTNVTITGIGFSAGTTVSFGGATPTNVRIVNGTTITVTAPAHAPGSVNVTISRPDGTLATLPDSFTFVPDPPPSPRPFPGTPVPGSPLAVPSGRSSGMPTFIPTPIPIPASR